VPERDALLVDYGGVLTTSVTRSFRAYCRKLGLPPDLAKEAFVEAYAGHEGNGPVHRMETGEITVEEFSAGLAQVLTERSGIAVPSEGLVRELFALMDLDETMLAAVAAAKRAGIRTALLSNSWGSEGYPRERFPELFDVVVISGEVGIRKPDPAIFALTAQRLSVDPTKCVFVDDLDKNIVVAEQAGMAGVLHRNAETSIPQIASLLDLDASVLGPASLPGTP
jgi:putative hydrolase of the HAD superfamily